MKKVVSVFLAAICCFLLVVGASASKSEGLDDNAHTFNFLTDEYVNYLLSVSAGTLPDYNREPYYGIYTTNSILVNYAYLYDQDFLMGDATTARQNFMAAFGDSFKEIYQLSGYPTNKYNCHAYAWYGGSEAKQGWIDYPYSFYEDVHCIPITNENDIQEGDIVVYVNENVIDNHNGINHPKAVHSAVINNIYSSKIECISKCGYYGLYKHSIDEASRLYDYTKKIYYRYVQDEHCEVYTDINSAQHAVTCSPNKENANCNFYELHSTNYTSLGNDSHRAYCSQCDYNITKNHDLYIYQDNGEDGCIVKCYDCSYVINCPEMAEYDPSGESGHYISCPSGDFSFFAEHDNKYTKIENNLYYHDVRCLDCGYTYQEEHSWELISGVYRCSYCGITASYVPDIMSLSDEELEAMLATLSEDEVAALIAGLDPDARDRVASVLEPSDDDLVTE